MRQIENLRDMVIIGRIENKFISDINQHVLPATKYLRQYYFTPENFEKTLKNFIVAKHMYEQKFIGNEIPESERYENLTPCRQMADYEQAISINNIVECKKSGLYQGIYTQEDVATTVHNYWQSKNLDGSGNGIPAVSAIGEGAKLKTCFVHKIAAGVKFAKDMEETK